MREPRICDVDVWFGHVLPFAFGGTLVGKSDVYLLSVCSGCTYSGQKRSIILGGFEGSGFEVYPQVVNHLGTVLA